MKKQEIKPTRLSYELRCQSGGSLQQRRAILGLSLVAAGSMGLIALYQMGILKHLPEPPLAKFDADKVDASEEAYAHLQMPDAVLGFGSYAATMALAAAGGKNRFREKPWLPLALAGKAAYDAHQAALRDMVGRVTPCAPELAHRFPRRARSDAPYPSSARRNETYLSRY